MPGSFKYQFTNHSFRWWWIDSYMVYGSEVEIDFELVRQN